MPRRLAFGALLTMAIHLPPLAGAQGSQSQSPLRRVTFTFRPVGHYEQVFLAGTFNGWSTDATPMRRVHGGFEITMLLSAGEYQYKFVADGNWITDETAERFHPDGFGGRNSVIVVDESFEPADMMIGDGRIMLDGLAHREDAWGRTLNADGTLTLRVRTWMGDVERAEVHWVHAADLRGADDVWPRPNSVTMDLLDCDGTHDYYESRLDSPKIAYYFELIDSDARAVVDAEGSRSAGADQPRMFKFNAAQAAAFATPDWIKEGIIYQIFPERFANGNPGNDPDFAEWYYEGLTDLPPSGKTNDEYFHLVSDWYDVAGLKQSPYKTDGTPDWNSFYGGDIEGVRQNLDYLEDLGITVIYFNPIFEAKSNHKYDAATYMKVDPHFGTNEEVAAFVADCHARNIRVILDLAINHTGHTFWAFVDAREKGFGSPYRDWYEWSKWPVPGTKVSAPVNASEYYDCWWGFGQMPNLSFDLAAKGSDENGIADTSDAEVNWPLVNHLLNVAEFWLSEADVDGYRLDVANEVPPWFWELFRKRVKAVKPEAYIVGELWGSSPEWVTGRCFDAAMNYKFFRDPVLGFIARQAMDAQEFDRALAPGRLVYPEEGVRAMMNLLGSHDTERFLTVAGGDIRKIKLAMLFAMTYVGAPTIYYGDEVAMSGGGDPDCRRPFYWRWHEESGRVEIHDYVRSLVGLRKEHPCLARGTFQALVAEGQVYAFRRISPDDEVIVVMNAGAGEITIEVPLDQGTVLVEDAVAGRSIPVTSTDEGPSFMVTLGPISGAVFLPVAD